MGATRQLSNVNPQFSFGFFIVMGELSDQATPTLTYVIVSLCHLLRMYDLCSKFHKAADVRLDTSRMMLPSRSCGPGRPGREDTELKSKEQESSTISQDSR